MNRDAQGYRTVRLRTLFKGAGILLLLAVAVGLWQREALFQQVRAHFFGNAELVAEKYGRQLVFNVDGVEVFEIEEGAKATNSVSIWIGPLVVKRGYGAKRVLEGAEAKVFMEHWSKMHFHWGLSGMCHDPAFVVRFLKGNGTELETTLCFACQNFRYPTLLGEATMGFDSDNAAGRAFIAQVQGLFPDSPKWAELEKSRLQKGKAKE
jgi:hypothetical protein